MKEILDIIRHNRQCGQTSALIQVCQSNPNALLIMGKEILAKAAVQNGCPSGQVITVAGLANTMLSPGTMLLWDNTAVMELL